MNLQIGLGPKTLPKPPPLNLKTHPKLALLNAMTEFFLLGTQSYSPQETLTRALEAYLKRGI